MNIWFELFGIMGGILIMISYLPNAIRTLKTKNTSHLSKTQYILCHIGAIFFVIYGILLLVVLGPAALGGYGLLLSNGTILIMNSFVMFHMFKKQKTSDNIIYEK